MTTRDGSEDPAILQELIDAITRYEYRNENSNTPPSAGMASSRCQRPPHSEVQNREHARNVLLEILEGGLLRLSYDRLGLKISIAMVLAKACPLEENDITSLRHQLENALAYDQIGNSKSGDRPQSQYGNEMKRGPGETTCLTGP